MHRSKLAAACEFVEITDAGLDLWTEPIFEDWADGNRVGRKRAEQFVAFAVEHRDPTLLGRIVCAMVAKKQFGPVETGFCHHLGESIL